MATQLKTPDGEPEPKTPEPGNDDHTDTAERDFDAEARARGWLPEDEFKGDKARWVDAQTFIERTDTVMPLLKAERDRLKRELSDMKRDLKRFSRHATAAEERIRSELQAEMEKAVESGDLKGFRDAQKRADELQDKGSRPQYTAQDLVRAYDEKRDENPWYDRADLGSATEVEKNARIFVDRLIERRVGEIKPGEEPPPEELIGDIFAEVKLKFPELSAKPSRQKPPSDVAPSGQRTTSRNAKSWESLPAEARQRFERWIGQGLGDKDYYVKTFDWDGYAKAG